MNRIVIGVVLALFVSTVAYAKTIDITGCTKDKKAVETTVDLEDAILEAHPAAIQHIGAAFQSAANKLTAEEFQQAPGFNAFAAGLDEYDFAAIKGINVPEITGTCQ